MGIWQLRDIDRAAEFANQMQTDTPWPESLKGLLKVWRGACVGVKPLSGRLNEKLDTVRTAAYPDSDRARLFTMLENVLQDLFKYEIDTAEGR